MIEKYGRKLPIVLGLLFMGLSFLGLGFISFIDKKEMFIVSAIGFRLAQGVSSVMIATTLFSIGALHYKDHSMEYMSYMTAMEGLGTALGAPMGAAFYAIVGYDAVFYGCGALLILSAVIFRYVLN